MSDDISPDEYRSVNEEMYQRLQQKLPEMHALAQRDKHFIKYGIELGLAASVPGQEVDTSKERIDQVYQNRLKLNRKNGIKL